MWFVVIGVVMLAMNLAGVGPIGAWAWGWGEKGLWILLPFALAIAWWTYADLSGWSKRKAMEKEAAKREARRQKSLENLGLQKPGKGRR